MKILTLIIKQQYFNEILNGTKKQEFRDIRPNNVNRYLLLDGNGFQVLDEQGSSVPVKYDAIRFYVGYNKNRDTMLIEVTDAYAQMFVDEKGELIQYVMGQTDDGQDVWWVEQQMVYELGKILEYQLKGGEIIKPYKSNNHEKN